MHLMWMQQFMNDSFSEWCMNAAIHEWYILWMIIECSVNASHRNACWMPFLLECICNADSSECITRIMQVNEDSECGPNVVRLKCGWMIRSECHWMLVIKNASDDNAHIMDSRCTWMHYKFGMCLECVGEETTRIRGRNNTPPSARRRGDTQSARVSDRSHIR